jgi:hypothetical protein
MLAIFSAMDLNFGVNCVLKKKSDSSDRPSCSDWPSGVAPSHRCMRRHKTAALTAPQRRRPCSNLTRRSLEPSIAVLRASHCRVHRAEWPSRREPCQFPLLDAAQAPRSTPRAHHTCRCERKRAATSLPWQSPSFFTPTASSSFSGW